MFEVPCMFASDRVETPHICPRCKVILPPGEVTCYSCGLRLHQLHPENTPQLAQSSLSPSTRKDRTRKHSYGIVIYFISISLVIMFFAFLFFRAAGISLSTYIPFLSA